MQFMVTYTYRPETRNALQARFKETGGVPGDGAKMLGRWHALGGQRGFVLAESSDSIAMARWLQEWTDLLTFDVVPVNDDAQVLQVLGG